MAASRCFSAADIEAHVAVAEHLGGAGRGADDLVGLLAVAAVAVLERQLATTAGSDAVGRAAGGAARRGR